MHTIARWYIAIINAEAVMTIYIHIYVVYMACRPGCLMTVLYAVDSRILHLAICDELPLPLSLAMLFSYFRAQQWLVYRWQPLDRWKRRMDTNLMRWRLRRLFDRGQLSEQLFNARMDALSVISSRWRQITEEGLSLKVANQVRDQW